MAPRRRKGQPKCKAQSPPTRQVETEETQEEEAQEESKEVVSIPATTPCRTGRPAKTAGTAVADPDSPSDYAQDTDASSEVKKSRTRKVLPYEFSREQEGELVEWYQANPELYDKNCQQYRNKDRKYSLLDSKAKEFPDCTYAQLCQWFIGQRTRYGKLSQRGNKSGSGGRNVTPREQWIIDKWGFIKSHIVRVEMKQSNKKKKPLPSMSSEEEFDSLEGASGSTPSTSQRHSKRSRTTANSTAGSIPNATEVEERGASQQELIKQLMQQATEAREARQAMTQPQTPHERAVDTFQAFLKTELLNIPENMWFNYTMAAMKVAHNFSHPTLQLLGHIGEQQMGQPHMGLMGSPHQQAHQFPESGCATSNHHQ